MPAFCSAFFLRFEPRSEIVGKSDLKNIPRTAASQFFYGPWPKGKVSQDSDHSGILFRFRIPRNANLGGLAETWKPKNLKLELEFQCSFFMPPNFYGLKNGTDPRRISSPP